MLKTTKKSPKIKISKPPVVIAPYVPVTVRGPLPANWHVAQMVIVRNQGDDK